MDQKKSIYWQVIFNRLVRSGSDGRGCKKQQKEIGSHFFAVDSPAETPQKKMELCELCPEDNEKEASHLCVDCDASYCSQHATEHKRAKKYREHRITELGIEEEKIQPQTGQQLCCMCDEHDKLLAVCECLERSCRTKNKAHFCEEHEDYHRRCFQGHEVRTQETVVRRNLFEVLSWAYKVSQEKRTVRDAAGKLSQLQNAIKESAKTNIAEGRELTDMKDILNTAEAASTFIQKSDLEQMRNFGADPFVKIVFCGPNDTGD